MKADGRSKCTALHIFSFGDRWRSAANITPWSCFCPRKNPGTHCIGGWVDPRAVRTFGEENTLVPDIYDMIYLLTAIELSPGGSSTVHIYTQTIHRTIQNKQYIQQQQQQFWKSAGRTPSWQVLPWHLPYNRVKRTEKPQSG